MSMNNIDSLIELVSRHYLWGNPFSFAIANDVRAFNWLAGLACYVSDVGRQTFYFSWTLISPLTYVTRVDDADGKPL